MAKTKQTSTALENSTVDSTPVGSTTPAAGNFTTFELNGAAPNGHTLVGNGTSYVDAAAPPVQASQAAGLISNDGTSGSRQFDLVASPDSTPPSGSFVYQNTSGSAMVVTVSADGGGGGFHGVAYCDASPSPTTVITRFGRVNDGSSNPNYYPASATFIVPAGYYYGVSATSGGGQPSGSSALCSWTEWTL